MLKYFAFIYSCFRVQNFINTFPWGIFPQVSSGSCFWICFPEINLQHLAGLSPLFTFTESWGTEKKIPLSERILWETMHSMFPVVISLPDICQRSSRSQHHTKPHLHCSTSFPTTQCDYRPLTDFLEILQLCSRVPYLWHVKYVVKNNLSLRAHKTLIYFVSKWRLCWQRHSPIRPLASHHLWLSGVEDKAVYLNQRYCSIAKCSVRMGNNPTWYRCFVVVGLVWSHDPKRYAGTSVSYW
jgi:hypothetical protein